MIDTSSWKEFRIGDLLIDESLCIYGHNKKWTENENPTDKSIPVISGITVNNGIYYYTDDMPNKDEVFEDCLTITTRGEYSGTLFYHKGKFVLANNILTLPFANTNELTALFLKVSIEKLGYGGYNNYPRKEVLINDRIKLPATPDGQPDWDYMESYMKAVMKESEKSLENLKKTDDTKHLIDTSEWGEFKISDIFNIVKGTRLTKANMKDGTIKFVGSSAMNNGETSRIANNEKLHPANTITVCYNGSVGETFYQDEPFWASDDVNVLYPRFDMTKYIALFICPIIKAVGQKYAFTNKWKQDDMKAEKIKLPIDKKGEPDWQYMEEYMKGVIKEQEEKITKLQNLK